MIIKRQHPMSGIINALDLNISEEQWAAYKSGGLVQNCFLNLSEDEREFIISGFLPGEFDDIFSEKGII